MVPRRAVRKVGPFRTHALLQGRFYAWLAQWAEGRGEVGPSGGFGSRRRVRSAVRWSPTSRTSRTNGYATWRDKISSCRRSRPMWQSRFSPPAGDRAYLEHKIGVYLAGGSQLVIVVDPAAREARLHDASGERTLTRRRTDRARRAARLLAELACAVRRPRPAADALFTNKTR